jgi:hypothetical protein
MMNVLNAIVRSKKTWADKIRIAINWIIGIALASLAPIVNTEDGFIFAQSAWVLPTVALSFVLGEFSFF